ncbi:tandem-95 repeat protein, partial [Pelomonas sp. KK5]|uniref:Ig-like domain-containing protein n=1 Tax=Pelomonas sp. KK5 TaxID=1855730 RepID=UPI00117EADBA
NDALSYTVTTAASHGTVTIDANGAYTYTPTADYSGPDSFVVTVSDGHGGTLQATVKVGIDAVADIVADTVTTNEDTPVTFNVLADDSFENSGAIVSSITQPATGGTVSFAADGTMTFTPAANFNGSTSFTYTVTSGGVTETAAVTVNVTAVNDVPVLTDPGTPGQSFDPTTGTYSGTTQEDTAYTGRIGATDADNDPLSYTVATTASHGTVTVDANGAYTYTPTADYNGPDSFVVTVSDGHGGTVQATVNVGINAVTDIVADTITTDEDTPVTFNVLANDSFENSNAAVTSITQPAAGGTVSFAADGTMTFTPAADFNGSTSFSYTVTSGGVTETATVTVNVTAVNDAPVLTDPGTPGQTFDPTTGTYSGTTDEDTAYVGQIGASDVDNDALSYAVTTAAAHGTVSIAADGSYRYAPTADYNGPDSFVVTVSDGHGGTVQATIKVGVNAVADIVADTVTTDEDTPITFNVLANDSFENSGAVVTSITQPASGGTVNFAADGTMTFTPAANFNGSTTFSYTVTSGGVTETATVTINVIAVNDVPVLNDPGTPGQT